MRKSWCTFSLPGHPKGVQRGWGQGSVRTLEFFHSVFGKPCLHGLHSAYTGIFMLEQVQSLYFQWREIVKLRNTKTYYTIVCFQLVGKGLGKNPMWVWWSSVLMIKLNGPNGQTGAQLTVFADIRRASQGFEESKLGNIFTFRQLLERRSICNQGGSGAEQHACCLVNLLGWFHFWAIWCMQKILYSNIAWPGAFLIRVNTLLLKDTPRWFNCGMDMSKSHDEALFREWYHSLLILTLSSFTMPGSGSKTTLGMNDWFSEGQTETEGPDSSAERRELLV